MFSITGVTGKVGGAIARGLLERGQRVRAVVRDGEKGRPWSALGCDVEIASVEDAASLTKAFDGAEGVFLMTPPNYDPEPGFPHTTRQLRPFGRPSNPLARRTSCFSPRLEPMLQNPIF